VSRRMVSSVLVLNRPPTTMQLSHARRRRCNPARPAH
jgi:hypothetical protein